MPVNVARRCCAGETDRSRTTEERTIVTVRYAGSQVAIVGIVVARTSETIEYVVCVRRGDGFCTSLGLIRCRRYYRSQIAITVICVSDRTGRKPAGRGWTSH